MIVKDKDMNNGKNLSVHDVAFLASLQMHETDCRGNCYRKYSWCRNETTCIIWERNALIYMQWQHKLYLYIDLFGAMGVGLLYK